MLGRRSGLQLERLADSGRRLRLLPSLWPARTGQAMKEDSWYVSRKTAGAAAQYADRAD